MLRATDSYHGKASQNKRIFDSVIGMIFLGTPFAGSWEPGVEAAQIRLKAAQVAWAEAGGYYSAELPSLMALSSKDGSSQLDELVQKFGEMVAHQNFKVPVECFYETKPTDFSAYNSRLPDNGKGTKFDTKRVGIV